MWIRVRISQNQGENERPPEGLVSRASTPKEPGHLQFLNRHKSWHDNLIPGTCNEGHATNIDTTVEKKCPISQGNMLGPHLILLAKESDRDEGDAGDEEEDLEEDEEVEQVDGGLRQLKRSPLRPRHHLKLENTFYILMNNLY